MLTTLVLFALAGCGSGRETATDPPTAPSEPATPASATLDDQAAPSPAPAVPDETLRALEGLGYVPTSPTDNPEVRGVTLRAPGSTGTGLNLYTSRRRASALLTDMAGEVVHRWAAQEPGGEAWMHIEPLPDGSLLEITKDHHIAKYAWDSRVLWRTDIAAHHDVAVRRDGKVLALIRGRESVTFEGQSLPVLCDSIAVLDGTDGHVERTVPLLSLVRDELSTNRLSRIKAALVDRPVNEVLRAGGVGDVLHTNSVEIVQRDIPGIAPRGSVMLSFRAISRIVIVNRDLTEVLWKWGQGELDGQHDVKQLENGHLMLFDNGLKRGAPSRVIEIDPVTNAIVWSYGPDDLYSRLRGGAQELSNDNVLITESDTGRAIEVTRDGEVVWEFYNPDVRGSGDDAERGVIYRLNRFPRDFFEPLATPNGG